MLAGAEFEMVHTQLTEEMAAQYHAAATMWGGLRREFLHALGHGDPSPDNVQAKKRGGHLWRVFWAAHQRFFRHMCMAAKVSFGRQHCQATSAPRAAQPALHKPACLGTSRSSMLGQADLANVQVKERGDSL